MQEKRIKNLKELHIHKKYLLDACYKMATYFLENGNEDFALELMRRSFVHDISKLSVVEFHAADAFSDFTKDSKHRKLNYSDDEMFFLKEHWKNNRHHPEYWDDVNDMEDLDIAEMVCDWYARSLEFKDDLNVYINQRQEKRFAFPEDMLIKIRYYASILVA